MSQPTDSNQPNPLLPERKPVSAPVVDPAVSMEDAGAQALDEALSSSFTIIKFLMAALVVVFLVSGIFTVAPNEVAVVLRFGQPVGLGAEQLLKPGLHYALPQPVDEIVKIPVGQSHTAVSTTGWYAVTVEEEKSGQLSPPLPFLRPGVDGYLISSDLNIFHAKATLKYRIRPNAAIDYTFKFKRLDNILENLLNNSLIYAASQCRADAAIYKDRLAYTELVRNRLVSQLEQWQLGINIENLDVQTCAPRFVQTAFDEVLVAQQTARTVMSEAEAYARSSTNLALGQAASIQSGGTTRSNQVMQTMAAFADAFSNQLPYYKQNPELFKERQLLETMEKVLTNAQDKYFLPSRNDGRPREIRIQLSPEPRKMTEPAESSKPKPK